MTRDTYQQRLLGALRLRDVPGPAIAQALAEVDSHVAESGEDPETAFGPPGAYAERLAAALHGREPGRRGVLGWVGWTNVLVGLVAYAGSWLLADGLQDLVADRQGPFGTPAGLAGAVGLVLLGGLGAWLVARAPRERVLDPRTGRSMVPPMPWWAWLVVVGVPGGLLLLGYLATLAAT